MNFFLGQSWGWKPEWEIPYLLRGKSNSQRNHRWGVFSMSVLCAQGFGDIPTQSCSLPAVSRGKVASGKLKIGSIDQWTKKQVWKMMATTTNGPISINGTTTWMHQTGITSLSFPCWHLIDVDYTIACPACSLFNQDEWVLIRTSIGNGSIPRW